MITAEALDPQTKTAVLHATGAAHVASVSLIQSLWSGYGQILRVHLDGGTSPGVVVKRVRWPTVSAHPRGWTTSRSHERKVRSYEVETAFYRDHAPACDARCRVPALVVAEEAEDGALLVLEDLDAVGLGARRSSVTDAELTACLDWLANFHATFLGRPSTGLWPVGTYWHLATRPDELAVLGDSALAAAAPKLDRALAEASFQTLVHGDAKLANFCFSDDGTDVAAVDFQYVGGGPGIKDVAYFLGSCLDEQECAARDDELLDRYFDLLRRAVVRRHPSLDVDALCAQWRALYPVAWTDFYRFLAGWSPSHRKAHRYTRRLADEVLRSL